MANKAVNLDELYSFKSIYNYAMSKTDPRTVDYPFVWANPVPALVTVGIYVLVVVAGKKFMAKREAFNIPTWVLFLYNFGLVILSAYMVEEIIVGSLQAGYNYICAGTSSSRDPAEMKVVNALWLFYISKYIELFDTVWMILRKKFNQVTFLHVYHHSTVLLIWWMIASYAPSGFSCYSAALNSFVHVVMYGYYALSLIPSLREYLWWKRYITRLQLLQFVINLAHTISTMFQTCNYPQWALNLCAGYMITLIVLFSNFYMHEYVTKANEAKKRKHN